MMNSLVMLQSKDSFMKSGVFVAELFIYWGLSKLADIQYLLIEAFLLSALDLTRVYDLISNSQPHFDKLRPILTGLRQRPP